MGNVKCKRCGAAGLRWVERGDRWVLLEGGAEHICETVAGNYSRRQLYGAVDAMDPGELKELIGYCRQRLEDG